MLSQIHLSFSLPLPHIVYVFWVLVNLSSVEFLTFHCLYLSFLVRVLLEGIFVSEHRYTGGPYCLEVWVLSRDVTHFPLLEPQRMADS